MVIKARTYACSRCHVEQEHSKAAPHHGETLPPGWSILTLSGTPTITRQLCNACSIDVIRLLGGAPISFDSEALETVDSLP